MTHDDHDALIRVITELAALDRLLSERSAADQRALRLFAADARDKLEKVNEFRSALSDLTQTMMPRHEVTVIVEHIGDDVGRLQEVVPLLLRRADFEVRHGALEDSLGAVAARVSLLEGSGQGAVAARTLLFAVLGAIVALSGLAIALVKF